MSKIEREFEMDPQHAMDYEAADSLADALDGSEWDVVRAHGESAWYLVTEVDDE